MPLVEPEHYMRYKLLKDGGDFVILLCNDCNKQFYSSPCGEDNVEWDEARKCLFSVCPNRCHSIKKNKLAA
jgi:hypothetical protein